MQKSHKTADIVRTSLSPLMGVFFLKGRTGDSRHLAKKARMLPFLEGTYAFH